MEDVEYILSGASHVIGKQAFSSATIDSSSHARLQQIHEKPRANPRVSKDEKSH